MARPQKTGIDYFPFDVDLQRDIKLRKPKHKYGYLATEVYIALLCILYKDKGYYIDGCDMEDVAYTVLDYLQGKDQPTVETVMEIVEYIVECELFSSAQMGKNKVITSHRAQCTFYTATADRTQVTVDESIWMLSVEEMRMLSTRHSLYKNWVSGSKNEINGLKSTQSKGKKSKANKEEEEGAPIDTLEFFEYTYGTKLNNGQSRELRGMMERFGEYEVGEAIEQLRGRNLKHPLAYMKKYLLNEEKERTETKP